MVRVVLFYLSVSAYRKVRFMRKLRDKITPNPCSAIAVVLRRVGVIKLVECVRNASQ